MYTHFTDRARHAIHLANEKAKNDHHEWIDTEHLLFGLLMVRAGLAVRVVTELGIDVLALQRDVERLVRSWPTVVDDGIDAQQSPRVTLAIEYAIAEARSLQHHYVGTEHILLGLIREPSGAAARLLASHGLNVLSVERQLLIVRSSPSSETAVRSPPRTTSMKVDLCLSESAQNVIRLAKCEAGRLSHQDIGTLHILLGLLADRSGIAANVLKKLGIDIQQCRNEAETISSVLSQQTPIEPFPLSPSAAEVLDHAREESAKMRHNCVGTEHVLLGLLWQRDGDAAKALVKLGFNLDAIRQEVLHLFGDDARTDSANTPTNQTDDV